MSYQDFNWFEKLLCRVFCNGSMSLNVGQSYIRNNKKGNPWPDKFDFTTITDKKDGWIKYRFGNPETGLSEGEHRVEYWTFRDLYREI